MLLNTLKGAIIMTKIVKAELHHLEEICEISKKLLHEQKNENGFLVQELKFEDIKDYLSEFYVSLTENKVSGYIWINKEYPKLRLSNTTFTENIDLERVIYIKQVAVNPDFARRGIATNIYNYIFEQFTNQEIVACVATKPLINQPSINYHLKLGFKEIGTLVIPDYLGFETYEANVYYRNN